MSHALSDSERLEPDDLRTEVRHRPGSLPDDDAVKSLYIWCKRSPRPIVNRYTKVVYGISFSVRAVTASRLKLFWAQQSVGSPYVGTGF